jgi:hypothetical protein
VIAPQNERGMWMNGEDTNQLIYYYYCSSTKHCTCMHSINMCNIIIIIKTAYTAQKGQCAHARVLMT